MSKGIRKEILNVGLMGLKVLWNRVMHWYEIWRGEGKVWSPPHKKREARKIADNCWDRFEEASDKMMAEMIADGTMTISGPEIERQQYKRKPPKRDGFKEAA